MNLHGNMLSSLPISINYCKELEVFEVGCNQLTTLSTHLENLSLKRLNVSW